jgi:hypothetical protein
VTLVDFVAVVGSLICGGVFWKILRVLSSSGVVFAVGHHSNYGALLQASHVRGPTTAAMHRSGARWTACPEQGPTAGSPQLASRCAGTDHAPRCTDHP